MIDEDVPCEDILSQMNAAKSAIHKCGAGGAGGPYQALRPGRHRTRRCRQNHSQLHKSSRTIFKYVLIPGFQSNVWDILVCPIHCFRNPTRHEKGARKGGFRMADGFRECEARRNPGIRTTQREERHEKGTREGGFRMSGGFWEWEARRNPGIRTM